MWTSSGRRRYRRISNAWIAKRRSLCVCTLSIEVQVSTLRDRPVEVAFCVKPRDIEP